MAKVTPRLITRYLFYVFFPHFLMATGVLVTILAMTFFVQLLQWAAAKGIALIWTLSSFGDLLPYLLSMSIPVGFLVAMLLTLSQLSETGEVTALRASGFSYFEIFKPFLATAAVLSALLLYLNHGISPNGLHVFRDSFREGLRQITRLDIEARSLSDLGPFKFFAEKVDQKKNTMERVLLYRPGAGEGRVRVQAEKGSWRLLKGRGLEIVLQDGELQLPSSNDPSRLALGKFDRYTVFVPFITKGFARVASTRELTTPALRARLTQADLPERKRAETATEIATRSAIAFTPLVFFCVAAPLGMRIDKRRKSAALLLSLGVLFGFYALLAMGIIAGNRSIALASFAPWLSNAVVLSTGAWLMRTSFR